jgi:hypothetical protein
VADGKDATKTAVKPTLPHAGVDDGLCDPELLELPRSYAPLLLVGQPRNRPVTWMT